MDPLRQSVMINQFMMVTGATYDEAQNSLKTCNWQLEVGTFIFSLKNPNPFKILLFLFQSALSMFFQGHMVPTSNIRPSMDQVGSVDEPSLRFPVWVPRMGSSHFLTQLQMYAPANTPATPPNFSDALLSFTKLNAGSSIGNTEPTVDPHIAGARTTAPPQFASSNTSNIGNQR